MKSALVAVLAVGALANEYESLGQGWCADAAGQEVSNYYGQSVTVGANCQSVCDADDDCVAFWHDTQIVGYCVLYAPSLYSVPYWQSSWLWADLSHDSVTKVVKDGSPFSKVTDCMLKKAATVAKDYESLGQGWCADAAGQEVSNYYGQSVTVGANCQSVCDADDECVAFWHDTQIVGYCKLYAPSKTSVPYWQPSWLWADLSHDSVTKVVKDGSPFSEVTDCMLKKAATVAKDYESLGQGWCADAAGQEVSNYYGQSVTVGANCQSVCDADDECVAFWYDTQIVGYCVLYAPSRSSVPDGQPSWLWADLSHDAVTKVVKDGSPFSEVTDCMLKKAATVAKEYESLGQGSEFLV